jgi:tetratricopeptide (TPR) repeat protein
MAPGGAERDLSAVRPLSDHAGMTGPDAADPLQVARQALARGDAAAALRAARALLARTPDHIETLVLATNAAIALQDFDEALRRLEHLHRLDPTHDAARRTLSRLLNRRGGTRRRAADEAGARDDFERALALDPGAREPGFNLALSLHALGQRSDAQRCLDAHLQRHAGDVEARLLAIEWCWTAEPARAAGWLEAMRRDGSAERADPAAWALANARIGDAEAALTALPSIDAATAAEHAMKIADALRARGALPAALAAADRAWHASGHGQQRPGLRAALARLALPPIMVSAHGVAEDRARLRAQLDRLDAEFTPALLARGERRLESLAWSNFHLAYHGENDCTLQRDYARLIERAASTWFPGLAAPPRGAGRRRIGLLSSCWRDCTVGAWFGGWIDWLRGAGYEVHLHQLGPQRDAATERLAARADVFAFHRGALHETAQAIRAESLDLLIYPELGMDARLLPLAALRLAPRQALAWGHPSTSGFAAIDAYFTCAEMEPADAASHYSESLCALPGLGVDYARPITPPTATRRELGLPEDAPLVLLPHSLFKLHPDDDEVVAALAAEVPEARFVIFDGEHPSWRAQWQARVQTAFAARGLDPARHLHWVGLGSRARFLQINAACDLMLDSLRWSGGNTSLDALAAGLPIATCPGRMMRARQSAAMLQRLGLASELVCDAPAGLVARAADLLRDGDRCNELSRRIEAHRDALHEYGAARERFLETIAAWLDTPTPN